MIDFTLMADTLYDGIVEDGRSHNPQQARKIIENALRESFNRGRESERVILEFDVARAAGLAHQLTFMRGDDLLTAIRQLASGGRVRLIVENEEQKPALRLVSP